MNILATISVLLVSLSIANAYLFFSKEEHPYYTSFEDNSIDVELHHDLFEDNSINVDETYDKELYHTNFDQQEQTNYDPAHYYTSFPSDDPDSRSLDLSNKTKEPIVGNLIPAITRFGNPQQALVLLLNQFFAYVATQIMWFTIHFLFWDYSDTQPTEQFTVTNLLNYLSNKDIAIYNQFLIWGLTIFYSMYFLIPPVLLNAFPNLKTSIAAFFGETARKRRKRSPWMFYPSISSRNSPTLTSTDLGSALRNVLCPFCVSRFVAFNTIVMLANFSLWMVVPYLRNTMTGLNTTKKKKRSLPQEQPDWIKRDREELIDELRDIVFKAFDKYLEYQ